MKYFKSSKQLGVSLLELMVSLAIGIILLLALSSVYITANQSNKTRSVEETLDESARQIFERLQQDLNKAGFVDLFDSDKNNGKFAVKIAAIKSDESIGINYGRLLGKKQKADGTDYIPRSPFLVLFGQAAIEGKDKNINNGKSASITIRYQDKKFDPNSKSNLGDTAVDCNEQSLRNDQPYVENTYELDNIDGGNFMCSGNGGLGGGRQPLVNGVADLDFKYLVAEAVDTKSPNKSKITVYDSQSGLYADGGFKTAGEVGKTKLQAEGVTAVKVCVVVGAEPLTGKGNQVVREFQEKIPLCDGTEKDRPNADDRKVYRKYVKVFSVPNALYFIPERGN